jgi:hypothetical protein
VSSAEELHRRLDVLNAEAVARNELPVTHVVIAAPWIPTAQLAKLAMAFPEIVWAVTCHSNVGFLACDTEAIRLMYETAELQYTTHNVRAAANCTRMVEWASRAWGTCFALLPNLYDLSEADPVRHTRWDGEAPLRIGMFGAQRLLKNGITGAAAAGLLAAELRVPVQLLVSRGRDEGGSMRPLEEIVRPISNLTLVPVDWQPWPKFRRTVRHLHVHLQPSYTESCNVTVQDAIAGNVASAVGEAIHWVPDHWKADVDDPCDVARVAESLLHDKNAAADGRRALEEYVSDGVVAWDAFLLSRCGEHRVARSA